MEINNSPKYVVITGASSGIGRACARYLDDHGFHVFAGVRNDTDAEALGEESSNRLTPLSLDVRNRQSIVAATETINSTIAPHGLSGLVNNAGISIVGPLEYIQLDKFREQLETNLVGTISVTQLMLPLLRQKSGRIINIGSISGKVALPFLGPYAASKFALEAISDSWRVELRPWGISVSVIEPGNIETSIREKALAGIKDDIEALPPSAIDLYGPFFRAADQHKNREASSPLLVAKMVEHVLTCRKARPRYLIGKDARIISLIDKLPTGIRDFIMAKKLPK